MKSRFNLFKKEIARCNLCNGKIYSGDYYGHECDSSPLSITGSFDYYFCSKCVEKNCTFEKLGEKSLGKTYVISRLNGDRSRITIKS